jgi:hypothetical protein
MNLTLQKVTKAILFCLIISLSSCEKDLYENQILQNDKNLIVSDKPFDELYSNENFNNAFSKLSKNKTSRSTALQGKNGVEEKYGFTFSDLPAKVIEVGKKTSYTFLISSRDDKNGSFKNLVIEVDSLQEVKAIIVKYNPKKIATTLKNHIYFEGNIEIEPILNNPIKVSKTSKTMEYELTCVTEVVSACSKSPYDCHGDICGYTAIDVCMLAGGGGGAITSFGSAGNINNGGSINYGGGGSSTGSTTGSQTNYITTIPVNDTIPVYDSLQQQFVTSLVDAKNNFSVLYTPVQKNIFGYLSYAEYEDPIKTNVKDALIKIDLYWLKQQSAYDQVTFIDFLIKNNFSSVSVSFAMEIIKQQIQNPTLKLDINASFKSPFNIDKSTINAVTPEGQKFNSIYDDALTKSPEFQKLFVDIFNDSKRNNVKFEIAEHVYEDNNPAKKEVNATTSQDPITKNIIIKINKQILIAETSKSQTKIENAKTILHECIHAYLFIKANNPTVGVDFVKILNTMYPTVNEQHDFMYTRMIPTMQKVLGEIRDLVTTTPNRTILETEYTMHPTTIPLTSTPWLWNEYYKYLSYKGLDEASCFKEYVLKDPNLLSLFNQYVKAGRRELDR